MIGLTPYVLILLGISAVAMYFIFIVIAKQIKLFKVHIPDDDIRRFRIVLFMLSLTIVVMGSIPIAINMYTLFFPTGRPPIVPTISLIYSLGVHLQGLVLSYLIWRLYRLADNEKEMTDFTQKRLEDEAKQRSKKK